MLPRYTTIMNYIASIFKLKFRYHKIFHSQQFLLAQIDRDFVFFLPGLAFSGSVWVAPVTPVPASCRLPHRMCTGGICQVRQVS